MRHFFALFLACAIATAAWAAWTPTTDPKGISHSTYLEVTGQGSPTGAALDRAIVAFTDANGVKYWVVYKNTTGALAIVKDSDGSAITTTSTTTSTSTSSTTTTT